MSLVTAIKPQKNKKRVNVYLDGKFGFGLDLENFIKSGIKIEMELSEEKISGIIKEGEFQKTYDKILRFATLRPRSEKEFKNWVNKYKVHESIRDELFKRLERLELLNDKKFASWWVDQRIQFRSKSKKELRFELMRKGIDSNTIDSVLDESGFDEKTMIKKLFIKNQKKWNNLNGFERRKKIYSFLSGKGYNFETIREVIAEINED